MTITDTHLNLIGRRIHLEPLTQQHMSALLTAAQNEKLWQYLFYGNLAEPAAMQTFITDALHAKHLGTDYPFAVIHSARGYAIGCTRFRNISSQHANLEIGGTWYASEYHRTGINLECKYLLLRHAFEEMGCLRVQFKTDIRNQHSRQSIEKLGATLEGILRRSAIMPNGVVRDTAVYSLLDTEWSHAKSQLEYRLERPHNARTFITLPSMQNERHYYVPV